ncbi:DNA-binding response regulator [Psychromonas marina]|uniref:DNA-binding response regulator n=1 Tax=Psychromonas marina TaxID=88364 RepID=A0ABQ6E3H5_9GAMM|nr:response regulator transcription factor [Psychromonas marina]GLS91881.1 DNA-binding response regulator [Psychromonas marina]
MSHLVVIKDNLQPSELLVEVLNQAHHQVTLISEKENLLAHLRDMNADLVILDLRLNCCETLQFISTICERFATPILVFTEAHDECFAIHALQAGADKYLIKPYADNTLLVYIDTLLRRVTLEKQRFTFNQCSEPFSLKMSRLPLTETELLLMHYLIKNDGVIVSKAILQKEVLKRELSAFDRNLDMHISNIRRKLLNAGLPKSHIKTVHGKGYAFSEQVA